MKSAKNVSDNGSENVEQRRHNERRLTNAEFFKACEEVRNQRERLTTERPNYIKTAKFLSERLGFEIAPTSIKGIQEAVEITWESKKFPSGRVKESSIKGNASRALAYALNKLYTEVDTLSKALGQQGVEVPPTLTRLIQYYEDARTPAKERMGETVSSLSEIESTKQEKITPVQHSPTQGVIGKTGTEVIKEGDYVWVDGNHTRRRKVTKVYSQGRMAIVDGNWELQTSRLQIANNIM